MKNLPQASDYLLQQAANLLHRQGLASANVKMSFLVADK
jgi:hypothetical protein